MAVAVEDRPEIDDVQHLSKLVDHLGRRAQLPQDVEKHVPRSPGPTAMVSVRLLLSCLPLLKEQQAHLQPLVFRKTRQPVIWLRIGTLVHGRPATNRGPQPSWSDRFSLRLLSFPRGPASPRITVGPGCSWRRLERGRSSGRQANRHRAIAFSTGQYAHENDDAAAESVGGSADWRGVTRMEKAGRKRRGRVTGPFRFRW